MTAIQVECYSGTRYGERPRAFAWQGSLLHVEAVLHRWQVPDAYCFLVKTTGELVFELCYQESAGEWHVELRSQPGRLG